MNRAIGQTTRYEELGTLQRTVGVQAVEIVMIRDRLAGSQQARNAAEKGLVRQRSRMDEALELLEKSPRDAKDIDDAIELLRRS